MAIKPDQRYPGQVSPADDDYPYGSARNFTEPGDGTPWEADLVNDIFGFQQALLSASDITPSGSPDKVGASQYLEALFAAGGYFTDLKFATVADLKAGTLIGGSSVSFAKLAAISAVVSTKIHNLSSRGGGAFYEILTSAAYGAVPDGNADFYVGVGSTYVAKLLPLPTVDLLQLGAVPGGTANPVSILQSAFDKFLSLEVPAGDFTFTGGVTLNTDGFVIFSNSDGRLTHDPTAANEIFIDVTSDDVAILGVDFFGLGSKAVNREAVTLSKANCILVGGTNCARLTVSRCRFEQNAHGVKLTGVKYARLQANNAKSTASYCYWVSGCEDTVIEGNTADGSGADGFKTTDQNARLIINANVSTGHKRDGFDLFDGFFQSVLSNNVAKDNYLNGFECKGTPSLDYNFRDSVVCGNVSQGNNTDPTVVVGNQAGAGFAVVSVRGATFTGNVSTENINMGWVIENCQEDIFNGNSSNKNGAHGYLIGPSGNVSRTSLVGNQSYDNSADTANTYDGFHFGPNSFCNVIACESHKGSSGTNNDQRYGYGFTAGANVTLNACHASGNVSGDIGGTTGNSKIVLAPNWVQQDWTRSNFSTSRSVDASTATTQQLANAFCTLLSDLEDLGFIK